jgi:hypothetical protein
MLDWLLTLDHRFRAAWHAFNYPGEAWVNRQMEVYWRAAYEDMRDTYLPYRHGTSVQYVGEGPEDLPWMVVGPDPHGDGNVLIIDGPPYREQRLRRVHITNLKVEGQRLKERPIRRKVTKRSR